MVRRRWVWLALGVAVALLAALAVAVVGQRLAGGPTTGPGVHVYLDALAGDDAADGTAPDRAWRSPAKLRGVVWGAGSVVSVRRGSRFDAPLDLDARGTQAAPVVVASYGDGDLPWFDLGGTDPASCVTLSGSWLQLREVHASRCGWAGFEIRGSDITVAAAEADGSVAGVAATAASRRAVVEHNRIHDNDRMSVLTRTPSDDDSGAFGVALLGRDAVVRDNVISGCHGFSYDFGTDGAGVEVYDAPGSRILRNTITDCQAGIEIGGRASSGTVIGYNVITSAATDASGVITRGTGDPFGPVADTAVVNNTILLSGSEATGVRCGGNCQGGVVTLTNDVVSAAVAISAGGAGADYCVVFGALEAVRAGAHITVRATAWTDATRPPPEAVGAGTPHRPDAVVSAQPTPAPPGAPPTIGAVG